MSKKNKGFTIIEILIVLIISSAVLGISTAVYNTFRKAITRDQNTAAMAQNARVALDRISREVRQASGIVTAIPVDENDTTIPQPNELEFEDGHANDISYKRYYISGTILKMDINEYYFSYDTANRVSWNAIGNGEVSPIKHTISTQDIADNVQSLEFYGAKPLEIVITTTDYVGQNLTLRTKLYERNL